MEATTAQFLRECFEHDPEAGTLTWKERPLSHFANARGRSRFNTMFAGRIAGGLTPKGYRAISLYFEGKLRRLYVHRILWALVTGAWPVAMLDHANGARADNRFANLRECSCAENGQNRRPNRNGSGVLGATQRKRDGKWLAQIQVAGKSKHLGYFDSQEEAGAAYLAAKKVLHPFATGAQA